MITVIDYLRENEILGPEHTKWWVEFEDGKKVDLVEMIREYSSQVITECSEIPLEYYESESLVHDVVQSISSRINRLKGKL